MPAWWHITTIKDVFLAVVNLFSFKRSYSASLQFNMLSLPKSDVLGLDTALG